MEDFSLIKRFVAGLLDKILIVILFVIGYYALFQNVAAFNLGKYSVLITLPPSHYEFIKDGESLAVSLYVNWILFAALYLVVCEFFLGASLFKRLFGGILYSEWNKQTFKYDANVLLRAFLRIMIMTTTMFVFQRFSQAFCLCISLLIIDSTVLFKRKSLIDIMTGTNLVKRSSVVKDDVEQEETENEWVGKQIDSNIPRLKKVTVKRDIVFIIGIVLVIAPIWLMTYTINKDHKKYVDIPKEYNILENEALCVKKNTKYFNNQTNIEPDNIRPMPEGTFMSSFSGYGDESCLVDIIEYHGYVRNWDGYSWYERPNYKEIRSTFRFYWQISVFDVSKNMYSTSNDSLTYSKWIKDLIKDFDPNDEYKSLYKKYSKNKHEGVQFSFLNVNNGDSLYYLRTIFFNNRKAYMVDVFSKSKYINFETQRKNISNTYTTFDYTKFKKGYQAKLWMILTIFIIGLLIIGFNAVRWLRQKGKNKSAWLLYCYSSAMLCCTFAWIMYDFVCWVDGTFVYDQKLYNILCVFAPISILLQCLTGLYCYKKSQQENDVFYMIPDIIKRRIIKDYLNEGEKKSLLVFVAYPLFICVNIPIYGFLTLVYIVSMLLMIFATVGGRLLYNWITDKKEVRSGEEKICKFKDYYLILDLAQTASSEEIDAAFNKAIARCNAMMAGNSNKEMLGAIREAYRVLSSSMIRPLYDAEYGKYCSSNNFENYIISDSHLKHIINEISEEVCGKKEKKKRDVHLNAIVVAFILLLLSLIPITSIIDSLSCEGDLDDYYEETNWFERWEYRWDYVVNGNMHHFYNRTRDSIVPW